MNNEKPLYKVGDTIICLTLPESCLVTGIDDHRDFYEIIWLLRPADGYFPDKLSCDAAHKYFKKIEELEYGELKWPDSKLAT